MIAGVAVGLWQVYWPWSRLNRDLDEVVEKHGFARRSMRIFCFGLGFDIEIEACARWVIGHFE